MVGMREAQDEYPKPDRKKNIAFAKRNCFGVRARVILSVAVKLQI